MHLFYRIYSSYQGCSHGYNTSHQQSPGYLLWILAWPSPHSPSFKNIVYYVMWPHKTWCVVQISTSDFCWYMYMYLFQVGSETPLIMRWKAAAEHSILTDKSYLRLAISVLQVGTNAQKQLFSAIIQRTIPQSQTRYASSLTFQPMPWKPKWGFETWANRSTNPYVDRPCFWVW